MHRYFMFMALCCQTIAHAAHYAIAYPDIKQAHIFTLVPHYDNQPLPYAPRIERFSLIKQLQEGKTYNVAYVPLASNRLVAIHKDVSRFLGSPKHICIFARGYSRPKASLHSEDLPRIGGGVHAGIMRIHANLVHEPCVVLDFPDTCSELNFGLQRDLLLIAHVYQTIRLQYPDTHITLAGDCLGALRVLSFATQLQELGLDDVIDTLMLESPVIDMSETVNTIADSYLSRYLGGYARPLLHYAFHLALPYYNAQEEKRRMQKYAQISGKTIFVSNRTQDSLINAQQVDHFCHYMSNKNRVIHFHTHDTGHSHSKLTYLVAYQDAVNYFLQQSGHLHNTELACRGAQLLEDAQKSHRLHEYCISSERLHNS